MKKLFLTSLALIAGAALVQAQGYLQLTSGVGFGITTNTGIFGNPGIPNLGSGYSSIISGETFSSTVAPGAYDFAFLYIPTGIGTSGDLANLADGNWEQLAVDLSGTAGPALMGTNDPVAGNFEAQGGANSSQTIGINGDAFNNGTTYSIAIVGWTSNEGSSWSQIIGQYTSTFWNAPGFFGYTVGSVDPGSSIPGSLPTGIWGNNSLVLYSTPVPEPATLALAGVGGLSMLFLRRRKA
jgi:hypothetical protein